MEYITKIYDSFIAHHVIKAVDDSHMPYLMKIVYHIAIIFRIFSIPLFLLVITFILFIKLFAEDLLN